ncbi:MAG: hypothetical protein EBR82_75080 [Caulobacteraceae bacterium]|nr:hypothetical protein [Caulobacteraceae bacterium]
MEVLDPVPLLRYQIHHDLEVVEVLVWLVLTELLEEQLVMVAMENYQILPLFQLITEVEVEEGLLLAYMQMVPEDRVVEAMEILTEEA